MALLKKPDMDTAATKSYRRFPTHGSVLSKLLEWIVTNTPDC